MNFVSQPDIESRLDWVLDSPKDTGSVELIVVLPQKNKREKRAQTLFLPRTGYWVITGKRSAGKNSPTVGHILTCKWPL